jgi:hypothetical protein
MKDDLQGWYNVSSLTGQCAWCKNKLVESHVMAACEYGDPRFPHATKCAHYEPEDLDE